MIKRCLDAYDGDSSRVINEALEGTIPETVLTPLPPSSLPQVREPAFGDQRKSTTAHRSSDLATAAATGLIRLSADKLWQGKKADSFSCQELNQLPAMGSREKRVTTRLAVSIWEEVEDEDRGNPSAEEIANPNHMITPLDAYDDEYDDTYDINVGTVEKDDSDDATAADKYTGHGRSPQTNEQQDNSSRLRHAHSISTNQQSYWPLKGANFKVPSGVNYANTSQHQPPLPSNRPHVLPIENPEIVRERQNHYRAHRRGRLSHPAYQPVEGKAGVRQASATEGSVNSSDQMPWSGERMPQRNTYRGRFNSHNRRRLADKKRQLPTFN